MAVRLLIAGFVTLLFSPLPAGAGEATETLKPGDLVVAEQATGRVVRIGSDGTPDPLLTGLGAVRAVVVLSDGAVLATDSREGTIVGVGGRFGDGPTDVVDGLVAPEALALDEDERLYVTSFSEGTLSRVDLDTGQVEALAGELQGPAAVLPLRDPRNPRRVLVGQWFDGSITVLARGGRRVGTFADGLDRPAGLAMAPSGTVYVADRGADRILSFSSDGRRREVANVPAPSGVTLDPATPTDEDFDLVVTTADGVERVDPDNGQRDLEAELDTAVGVATAPDEFFAAGTAPADPTTGEQGDGSAADGALAASGEEGLDKVLVGLLALAALLAGIAVVTGIQLLRARRSGDDEEDDEVGVVAVSSEAPEEIEVGADEPPVLTRKERRHVRSDEKVIAKAERQAAREAAKAEKRFAKERRRAEGKPAPAVRPAQDVAEDAAGAEPPATDGRKERKEAKLAARVAAAASAREAKEAARRDKAQSKADGKAAKAAKKAGVEEPEPVEPSAISPALTDAPPADWPRVTPGVAASVAPSDLFAAPATDTELVSEAEPEPAQTEAEGEDRKARRAGVKQAKAEQQAAAKQAKVDAKQAKVDERAAAKQAKVDAKQAKVDERAAAKQAKVDAKQVKVDEKAAAKQAKVDERAAARAGSGAEATEADGLRLGGLPAAPTMLGLPVAEPLPEVAAEPEPIEAEPEPIEAEPEPIEVEPEPVVEPRLPEPVVEPETPLAAPTASLVDQVARPVSAKRGRRARKRRETAERRHQRLRIADRLLELPDTDTNGVSPKGVSFGDPAEPETDPETAS